MNETEAIIQERLELLEAGEPLAACLEGLTPEQGELLQAAAALRSTAMPAQDSTAVAAHRAAVLTAARQTLATRAVPQSSLIPLMARFQAIFTSFRLRKEPAWAPAFMLLLMLSVAWFGLWQVSRNSEKALNASLPVRNGQTTGSLAGNNHEVAIATTNLPTTHQAFFPLISVPLVSGPDKAALHNLRGLVEVQEAGGGWTAVTHNINLPAGSRIRTGSYSRANLTFYDGSQATLGPNSELSLDQVNALQAQAGFRTVVLTQWAGSSEHRVQFRNDGGSRYEVLAATGSGIARGTQFEVAVSPDGRAHYTVTEGKVDVSNSSGTVAVIAGQTTSFGASEPPALPQFTITGTGVVSQIGDTWIIAGQSFAVNAQTTITGDPVVGDMAYVEGYLDAAGDPVATLIQRLDGNGENQFTLTGPVEEMGETAWVVAGQTISVTADTQIDPDIAIDDIVLVQGVILLPGAHLVAATIEKLETEEGLPFEFVGVVQAISTTSWTISGITIAIDEETEIEGGIEVGDTVQVEGVILADDTWLAQEIELMVEDGATFTFTGEVMGTDPWLVAGITFEVADWAYIEPGIEVGDLVRVSGIILDDGTWLATEIVLLPDEGILQIVFVGVVDSMDPWIISGLPITTDENTVIEGEIEVGDVVQVTAWIYSDGTWLATHIELLEDNVDEGCVVITAVITAINDNAIVFSNGQTIILDEGIVIEGELQVGSVVAIVACVAEDGTIQIVSITIIYNPTPSPVPPPPAPGGTNTICHKPGTPAEKTMTLPQSALGGHLGHGDTLGPCP